MKLKQTLIIVAIIVGYILIMGYAQTHWDVS